MPVERLKISRSAETLTKNKMSTTNHTPGPWSRVSELVGDEYACYVLADSGASRNTICKALIPKDAMSDYEQEVANTRLIASAPELLDALRVITERMRIIFITLNIISPSYNGSDSQELDHCAIVAAEALISRH